jgi:hypothetical protein
LIWRFWGCCGSGAAPQENDSKGGEELQDCEGDAKGLLSSRPLARAAYFFLAAVFFAAGFLAAVFFVAVFLAAGFLAAAFFAAGFAAAFLVLDFFAVVAMDSLLSERFAHLDRADDAEVTPLDVECQESAQRKALWRVRMARSQASTRSPLFVGGARDGAHEM